MIWGHNSVSWLVFGVSNQHVNGYGGDSGVFCCQDGMSIYGVDVGLVPEPLKFFLFDLGFGVSQNVRVDPIVWWCPQGYDCMWFQGFHIMFFLVRFSGFPHNVWRLQSNITWDWIEGSVLIGATMGLMVARYCGYCTYCGIVRTFCLTCCGTCCGAMGRQVSYLVA